jgi:hypothetical protein
LTAPPGTCLVFNNNTANGAACGQILGGIISKAVTPLTYWAYGATALFIIMGIALPIVVWRMGPLGRRLWGWKGDLAVFLFPNRTADIYKVTQAFSSWLRIVAKRVSGLVRSGTDTSFPTKYGPILHVVEGASRTSANFEVAQYTVAMDDVAKGKKKFREKGAPDAIPRSLDEAVLQYFQQRVRGTGDGQVKNLVKLKSNYELRYGEEIPPDVLAILQGTENPIAQLAKSGGAQLRRFRELVVGLAMDDPDPLWPIEGEGIDARVIFRWVSSQDHPVDFDVAYQTGYDDGKADQKTDDKRWFYVILVIAIFVGGAVLASVLK